MGLKIKRAPRQLEPADMIAEVWPGDPSVDLERSDLVTWCIDGGVAGLQFKDEDYQVWKLRPLRGRALAHVQSVQGPASDVEAFRLALTEAPGLKLRWLEMPGGLYGLANESIDAIEESLIDAGCFELDLPIVAALDFQKGVERDKVRQDRLATGFFSMLGIHVLAASFRGRR
jgi:hypothetical protein